MGIKGLQGFVQNSCRNTCSTVSLKSLAAQHRSAHPSCVPTMVVDSMCCLRTWYTPSDWVHGGQWKEYLSSLTEFIAAFDRAGIKLIFVFDGVIEQKKRTEWIKRRLQDNMEVEKIFHALKSSGQQPGRNMFFIPSGISTFTRFALKALGQQIICTQVEGDYEAAAYALQHGCLGILSEDSDYMIFNTVPYFSINKLRLHNLETLMYSRENLCQELGLHVSDLPLLASLLGNDFVPENTLESFHKRCLAMYPQNERNRRAAVIRAVAAFIAKIQHNPGGLQDIQRMLPPTFDMGLLHKGIESYILPEQYSPWIDQKATLSLPTTPKQEATTAQDQEVVQIALEGHYRGENTMICNVLCNGESDCSNTLEDEHDPQIPGQALVYKAARQHIYAILLGTANGQTCPVVKEWYVYPGNQLQKPELIPAVPLSIAGETPTARSLWLSDSPDIERRRFETCMACFHVERWTEDLKGLETHLVATCSLLIYLAVQVGSLSLTDVEAFLAQALCLPGKSASQLKSLQLPYVDSRGVHLAFLFLRGLVTLMGANSACGYPLPMMDLMPWNTFDGKLFHHKYLQCHQQKPLEEILDRNEAMVAQFQKLRSLIMEACEAQGRVLQPDPRGERHAVPVGCSHGRQQQLEYDGDGNYQWNVSRQQGHQRGRSGSFFPGQRPSHQYAHGDERRQWGNNSRQQDAYRGQQSEFNSSYERGGRRSRNQRGSGYTGEGSWHGGKRGRGHQFSNQWQ